MLRNQAFFDGLFSFRRALTGTPEIWQSGLLSANDFGSFAGKHGIQLYTEETIERLWAVGLLRAERIRSNDELHMDGLQLISEEHGLFTYFDGRQIQLREGGYGGSLGEVVLPDVPFEVSFHPFRVYVLHHIDRVFQLDISPAQYLVDPDGYERLTRNIVEFKNQWTQTQEFRDRFEDWNRTAELAIALEPVCYEEVFGTLQWRYPETEDSVRESLARAKETINKLLAPIDALGIDKVRQELCVSAEIIDDNKLLHVLLRIMAPHERLKLRSGLGLSMQFLSMAEILRRAFEGAHGVELKEEDELGFGQWMEGARKTVYGSERVVDAPEEVTRDFLRSMGLDAGTKARVYVEGETEFGALRSAVGDAAGTEIINLHGQVVESRRKGLSFMDSLKTDLRSHVFSFVLIDADRSDYVRALKKAAADGNFFGSFFIAELDVEYGNFACAELIEIAADFGKSVRQLEVDVPALRSAARDATSIRKLDAAWMSFGYASLKCEEWGIALMNYAVANPNFPESDPRRGQVRPIIEAARMLVRARVAGYTRSREMFRVDPESGKLVPR